MMIAKSWHRRAVCAGVPLLSAILSACATVRTTSAYSLSGADITYASGGNGLPVVVFESGLGNGKEVWGKVLPAVERTHQVFAYDRPGYGGSRSVAGPRDPCTVATEEHNLLRGAGIAAPYILVGHSIGGLYQYVYAKLYPQDVAGVVLVDPTHPGWRQMLQREAPLWALAGYVLTHADAVERREWDDMDDCLARIDMTVPLHVPARVLVQQKLIAAGSGDFAQVYRQAVTDWPRLTGTPVEEVSGSGHFIQKERPDTVIDAIAAVSHAATPVAGNDTQSTTSQPMEEVVVESLRHPEARSYVRLVKGMQIFEQYRQLAPRASLRFKMYPRKAGVDMHDLRLVIVSRNVRIPIELDGELRFQVPVDATALRENAALVYNRPDGSLGWRTDVRTPDIPEQMRRLGDLRLECRVELMGAHVARGLNPLGFVVNAGDPCDNPEVSYHFYAEKPIFDVTLTDGRRSSSLPTEQLYGNDWNELQIAFMDWRLFRDRVFLAPLRDKTWSDDTLIGFIYMEEPPK